MAVTLIVEDGQGLSNANSYIDAAFARQFAENRGVTLPAGDDEVAVMIIMAADYIESFAEDFKGSRKGSTQALSWPRINVVFENEKFPSNSIPPQLKMAQAQAVVEIFNGQDLSPAITGYAVRREKVDVIEVEYAAGGSTYEGSAAQFTPKFPKILQYLRPLMRMGAGLLKVHRA